MKSYPAPHPPAGLGEVLRAPVTPTDPTDVGDEDIGCHLCGAVFIRRATTGYIRRVRYVYCRTCRVWSQAEAPPT
jgi:hypothetical protein